MGESGKIKYAIGLFMETDAVSRALTELRAHQWPTHQIKVIAMHNSLQRVFESWQRNRGESNVCNWIVCRAAQGACPWQFDLMDPPAEINLPGINPLPGFSHWVPERQARQLDDHLRAGGELVVIRSRTPSDERAACTTLLRYARIGIQTHEVGFRHLR